MPELGELDPEAQLVVALRGKGLSEEEIAWVKHYIALVQKAGQRKGD
jgi:hypothetical protein